MKRAARIFPDRKCVYILFYHVYIYIYIYIHIHVCIRVRKHIYMNKCIDSAVEVDDEAGTFSFQSVSLRCVCNVSRGCVCTHIAL